MDNSNKIVERLSDSLKSLIEIEINKQEVDRAKSQTVEQKVKVLEPKDIVVLIKRGYPNYLITVEEARGILKLDTAFMRRLVSTGLIKSLARGDGRKISRYEVDDFIERNQGKNLDELLKAVERGDKIVKP
ncbi:TPA: helix-turn-helix domain-containing protein [Clostridioides difficile]|uniref:helix-turn-helix domain-containing protein n=1 Tax=Clostridioides difficile TaxID=1496 RepID=UPI0009406025|nr:helix-turn-helix domain-containing protein [Clostridioides difficile]EGT3784029.1 DNA-binding protein [Clostridioides difficile]EGT5071530.1 DNA-binding protein [Clostridioides difficile]EII6777630.1 helix-turn-helix domain-containing protein [Clostridioides difficile]ELX4516416.1 helix-turn-helix domain-containing protein [Clostridioides difficile]MBY1440696.1 helix-turn-helix domain-containing protein [Clostridioides difficile]